MVSIETETESQYITIQPATVVSKHAKNGRMVHSFMKVLFTEKLTVDSTLQLVLHFLNFFLVALRT